MKTWFFTVFALFISQSVFAIPDEGVERRTLRFLFIDETPGAYFYEAEDGFRKISSTPYAISQSVPITSSDKLKIYKEAPIWDPQTKQHKRFRIATVSSPADQLDALVLITPRQWDLKSQYTPDYLVKYINSDDSTFPEGTVRVINLGHEQIAASMGGAPVVLDPGANEIIQPNTDQRNRLFSRVAVKDDEQWRLIFDNITVVRPQDRMTGICVYSPSGLAYRYLEQELEELGQPGAGHYWLYYSESAD
ncbi:hypothetical protein [Cerasicoccus arenae]|uniref:Uncharacterized protein n=1 Tax=Cerasicoccus arenae TaxID=424488 RepID=A0A8J3DLA2_9BACT|nr:hypothetical protein [Cerasicoccus arenae]MBK1858076.1 hypothetical protein [Cerasicoccus arenae]GHC06932.1 hypothetical protein GCM10007047_24990 [Cerasicoccus arenae]